MRLQFFGDRQDFFKWNALREELRAQDYYLIYVPMFTGLYGLREGDAGDSFLQQLGSLSERVERFLDEILSNLFREYLHQRTKIVTAGYRKSLRESYFLGVLTHVREIRNAHPGHPLLIFLDPDTGISPESGGDDGHVMEDSLRTLLEALDARDLVLIYQHRQRVTDNATDFEIRARQLARMFECWGEARTPSVVDLDARANSYLIRV
ncbi:MAG: hypothetical protein P4M08_12365 [Oligoflexia bacterium]|nr:hypothetical protein [Oligoflexia bacterium]